MANEFMFGRTGGIERAPIGNQQQRGAQNQLLQMALSRLQGSQPDFAPIEKHARTQFQQQTLPGILERLTSMGGQRSGALDEATTGASERLETGLAGMRGQFDMQNRSQLMQMLDMGLQPQDQMFYRPGTQGFAGTAGAGIASGLGSLLPILVKAGIGGLAGGPAGAAAAVSPDVISKLMQLLGMLGGGQQQGTDQGGSIQAQTV